MKRILIYALVAVAAMSCAGRTKTEELRIPIVRYSPATYFSDIESALADPSSCAFLSAGSQQLDSIDKDILAFISEQNAFVVSFKEGDAFLPPGFIGIKDKEKGYLKYLNVEEEQFRYSLDEVIKDQYGSLDDYIATWPEDLRYMFYDDPQGLYTFPNKSFAMNVVGYGNCKNPDNPVKFQAAITYLRTTSPEWNDDTWAADSAEIVKFSDSITGIHVEYVDDRARFADQDANYFSKWVNEKLTYPDAALEDASIGRVTVQFKIDMFGNLEDVKFLRERHPALDSIAFNVVSSSPQWTPAKDFLGNPRSARYILPVIFTPEMMFKAFITKMYNDKLYEDYDFLRNHCSPELLRKLQDACPYDTDEPAYATWLFRSGMQDSRPGSDDKTTILEVSSDGDWYMYKALDMGNEFTNRIRLTTKDNKIIIEDLFNIPDRGSGISWK